MMNLEQIRTTLGDLSGRTDLAEENTDLADFFINEGSKYLDRNSETQKTWANNYSYLAVNSWYVQIPFCRAFKEVWLSSTTAKWQLEKISLNDMMSELLTTKVSLLSSGSPCYYCPAITRNVPEGSPLPTDITDYSDILSTTGSAYNAILVAPVPNESLLVNALGIFYSKTLTLETDENYWSVVHPSLLIQAALREIEIFNRNSTGVKDWESAITSTLDGINKDLVEEQITDVDQMEG